MNNPYPGISNKSITNNTGTSGMQFYNPNKDPISSLIGQHSQSSNVLNTGGLSNFKSTKQFNFKPNPISGPKIPSNSSTFIKPSTQYSGGSNKFIPSSHNNVSSSRIMNKTLSNGPASINGPAFTNLNHNKSLNSQMIKSSIQDMNSRQFKKDDFINKQTKFKTFQTTPKRLPRMSEPNDQTMQSKQDISGINQSSQNADSPPAFLKGRQKQKDNGFHKFKQFQSPLTQKLQKQSNYGSYRNMNTYSPFRGVQSKNSLSTNSALSEENSSFGKRSIGNKGNKIYSMKDFDKIKQLGAGKYGKVFLARQKCSGFVCAVKMIEKQLLKQEQIVEQFIRELKIQIFLNHPHIIKMYGYFDDETCIYIILQVGTGGQLYRQLKRSQPMPQAKVAGYIRQVCQAVNEIHSLRIIHRDIKPENIVLHQNIIKLCDFGWSVHQDNKMRTTFCGTPLYVCPQILRGKQYDQKIDIWSLGIMMYEMLVGQNPFKITKQEQLIKIVKDKIQIPSYVFVSGQARDFLDKCLQKNPLERVNVKQLLSHDFFKKYPDKSEKKMPL